METPNMSPDRKKKIKTVLSMMNKQNRRLIPVAGPLIEMMNLTTTDDELDFLLKMGTGHYTREQAEKSIVMSNAEFDHFFETLQRKGLVHVDYDADGKAEYRLNAIAVGWYECMVHYLMGKPQEIEFSQKWNAFFQYFTKFNFFPLRNIQNLILPALLHASQDTGIMDPKIEGKNKRKVIPIKKDVSIPNQTVYPFSYVNALIDKFGEENQIYAFPCVCRHGNHLIGSGCDFDMQTESCISFGSIGRSWASWGYGRNVSKAEAMDILKHVREHGAVHSVIHERDDHRLPVMAICNCCWDCCGILKPYNMGAISLKYNAAFAAQIKNEANCKACGICEKYCPTTAIHLRNKKVTLNPDKCIGCGQCAFQCRQNNIELYPDQRIVFLPILEKSETRIAS